MTAGLSATTRARLVKLVPRLATSHDGEVIATVRAIQRTLAAAGSDFHALAAYLDTGPVPERPSPARASRSRTWNGLDWRAVAALCRTRPSRLQIADRELLDALARLNGVPTDLQLEALCRTYNRVVAGRR